MAEYDLISKTALLKHLDMAVECKDCPRNGNKELYKCVHNPTSERCTCSDIAQICIRITEFATFSDVQPIKHGRWIGIIEYCKKNGYIPSGMGIYYWCSECDKEEQKTSDFCPNCGADMRGEQK